MNLIQEAIKRGYRKGTPIRYVPHAIDFVEGAYFEVVEGDLRAYAKPTHERKCFEDWNCDTLYRKEYDEWVEIVDLTKRSKEQVRLDNLYKIK